MLGNGNKALIRQCSIVVFCILAVYGFIWSVTNLWPWEPIHYNTYTLQAQAWLNGRLDLGQNHEHLELALYDGKFFVSFPPFPSYLFYIIGGLFGYFTFDGWLALASTLLGGIYVVKLLRELKRKHVVHWSLFLMVGSNLLFVSANGWVWFIAQNLCFTLSIMALYYLCVLYVLLWEKEEIEGCNIGLDAFFHYDCADDFYFES